MADLRIGVRIVADGDYVPGGDDDENAKYAKNDTERAEYRGHAAAERAKFADGTWSAYGLVAVHECPVSGCDDTHDGITAAWSVVVPTTTLAGCVVWDPAEVTDDDLRLSVVEIITEEREELAERMAR